jgi:predicted enzyme related to lactoylglutathione lyase
MPEVETYAPGTPIWVDLATDDIEGSKSFYAGLFGWTPEVADDPQAGGYTMFMQGAKNIAAVAPAQAPGQPTAWAVYIATDSADETARKVEAAGGKVVAPPFDVLDAGRMAVFQDPNGAFISIWEPKTMKGADVMREPNSLGWVELNSRDLEGVRPFYRSVFGWGEKTSSMGEGQGSYTEWQLDGNSVAGAMSMPPGVPSGVPSFWMVYFQVGDLDAAVEKANSLGARTQMGPAEYPGGRFAVLQDPQGAVFGLITAA